ncbi:sugar ABC transporter ATP-binding protein [Mesorhizobium sp.]|uniref:sugar ABC transporter ATP-binding protein n=1 Tax=Mesorhizobium sp. TaxID=1871066 RepID=UPI000FE97593|nr:sugar ABC transporter ATP-binding protein [Mesorhizobium sp.]RWG06130.1 MAG: sugar ABC transporter ATP-binding protein [Mesorhizobium sp.]TIN42195.1 MAG: sugar ABC transporter ATP-binding protein [Mesorhizobium sp.]TIR94945.1 MAG: sugar ABC transporter ATP-binding protein [Mesorhizobium sp.]TIS03358.1 MAG: sugar ABC transporter ATP-binding protein [Mesorhizobium sp.]
MISSTRKPLFTMRTASKAFAGITVVDQVNLDIYPNEIVGIAGENGAGKSTTLKMIAGIHPPSKGEMELFGREFRPSRYTEAVEAGISMVFQEQALIPNLAVYENMFLSLEKNFSAFRGFINRHRMIEFSYRHLRKLGLDHIDPRNRTSDYAFHDRQMIEIAKAFALADFFNIDHPIILLDEPTAAVGEREVKVLFESIRRFREHASFVLITHRLSEYTELCDRIYVLKDGRNVGEFAGEAISEQHLHRAMVGRNRDDEYFKERRQLNVDEAPVALSVSGLTGANVRDVSFDIRRGEIVGLGGLVGCGKEDVAKAIVGYEPFPTKGQVRINGALLPVRNRSKAAIDLGVGFVPKERKTEGIVPYMSVESNISLASLRSICRVKGFISMRLERRAARKYVDLLSIRCSSTTQLCQFLSGGNQQKVVLSKWLARGVRILILDNPTRGVDVGAKEEIYGVLRNLAEQGVSVLLVSDDLLELIGMSNRILIMREGAISFERGAPAEDKPSEQELVEHMV